MEYGGFYFILLKNIMIREKSRSWSERTSIEDLKSLKWLRERGDFMPEYLKDLEMKYHLGGWILFMVCAGFFIAASVADGNILSFIGSVIFLVACVLFIIPLLRSKKHH